MTPTRTERQRHAAPLLALLALTSAGIVWLALGPRTATWVSADDWQLVGKHDWSLMGLLSDHNQHLSIVPIAINKGLFALIGFEPYWPYQAITLACHAAVVLLVWAITVRVGVNRWLATACTAPLVVVLGGPVVVSQFQMTLAAALCLGQFLLMMGEPTRGRLILAAGMGLLAVATSGISVPMIAATGLVSWRRHGLRAAVAVTVPAGLALLLWWVTLRPDAPSFFRPYLGWITEAGWQACLALAGVPAAAVVLLIATALGLGLATRDRTQRLLEPVALAGAAIVLMNLVYLGRGMFEPKGDGFARFYYLTAILVLPMIAAAAQSLANSRPWLSTLVLVPLAVGTVTNLNGWLDWTDRHAPLAQLKKTEMAALLSSPAGQRTPDWAVPFPFSLARGSGDTPWGFLRKVDPQRVGLAGVAVPMEHANAAELRLALTPVSNSPQPARQCRTGSEPLRLRLDIGERIIVPAISAIAARLVRDGSPVDLPVVLATRAEPTTYESTADDLLVEFGPADEATPFTICR